MTDASTSPAPAGSVGPEPISRLPVLWVGYLLAGALLVAEVVAGLQDRSQGLYVREPPWFLLLISAAGAIYWLYCVYRFHDVMAQIPGYNHSITPWRAVAMHWIPFYNLYWVFKWPSEIATFVNWRMQSPAMKGWIAGLLVLLSVLVGRFVDGAIGLILLFSSGIYISKYLRRAFTAPPVPTSAMARPGARGPLGL